jgi:monofunctional biosynthetic peptidoglycan transglycosylase
MARDTGRAKSRPQARSNGRQPSASGGFWRFVRRLIAVLAIVAIIVPPVSVVVYRFVPPPITILMITRLIQGHGMDYQWRSLSDMSPALPAAAVASEDSRFCSNHGFDFDAIEKAIKNNERRPNRIRGGSTISQQTAKNVFLWPGRDYVRKAIEAWYTVLIEAVWGKPRIMEMYLNVVEFGPGVYGAEAASQRFFHKPAARLSPAEAARLIAVLPKPLKWDVDEPGRYVVRRTGHIDRAMGTVRNDGLADCVRR